MYIMFSKFLFTAFPPVKIDTNNRILNAPKAMPLKNDNAAGDSLFSIARHEYVESLDVSMNSPNYSNAAKAVIRKKKYLGSTNRDMSALISRKTTNTIGLATLNAAHQNIAFSSTLDKNAKIDAIARVRGKGGCGVPKKTLAYKIALDVAKSVASVSYNKNILIIGDNGAANQMQLLASELINIQNANRETNSLGYTQSINFQFGVTQKMLITYDTSNNPTYYDGSDLKIANFSIIILFVEDPNSTVLGVPRGKTVYNPNFGTNLNKYLISGGNLIISNYCWQNNNPIPNFSYGNTPFIYAKDYTYGTVGLNSIVFKAQHPVLTAVSPNIQIVSQSIVTNIKPNPQSSVIATTANNIPFVAVSTNPKTGARSVGINGYIGTVSPNNQAHHYSLIVYNSVYWCLRLI